MRVCRLPVFVICLVLASALGGCIFDYGGECDDTNIISGSVLDSDGLPVADIKISAFFDIPEGVEPVADCSTYTDSRGYYSIPFDPPTHEILVLPAGQGCVFTPHVRSYSDPTVSILNQDFLGYCGPTCEVSGRVVDEGGQGIQAAIVTLKDTDGFERDRVVTDASGYYAFNGLAPIVEYVVTPWCWCEFTPRNRAYSGIEEDLADQDFTGTCGAIAYVDGYVRDSQGHPVEGVTVEVVCIGPIERMAGACYVVYTDQTGYYLVGVPHIDPGGCYVEPRKTGCRFMPPFSGYDGLEDVSGEDYTAYCGDGYDIDGRVLRENGDPYQGSRVGIWGDMGVIEGYEFYELAITDADGSYRFDNLVPGVDYFVMPGSSQPCPRSETDCGFDPPERNYYSLDNHHHDQDYTQVCP
jgi:hypothetical protein